MSIYETLGREHGIRAAVDEFYDRVLGDSRLQHYFTGVNIPHLRRHQVTLLAAVTGGPNAYQGRDLGEAHRRLSITHEHFDLVVDHLGATLDHLGVAPDIKEQIAAVLGSHRDEIASPSAMPVS